MLSVDHCLTKVVKIARATLGTRYQRLYERFGPPSENSPLSSLHFLLAEYQEPEPFVRPKPYLWDQELRPIKREILHLSLPGRGRKLRVDLALPAHPAAELPTVVISPGLGAHPNANRYLEDYLAGRGYLVARPRHCGSDWLGVTLKTPLGAFTRAELKRRLEEMEHTMGALLDGAAPSRPAEGTFCLAGHSFGALTCAMLAGLQSPGLVLPAGLPVRALVVLSPYGNSFPTQRLGIDPSSFGEVSAPTLFVSGSRDDLFTLGKGPGSHLEPYLSGPTENRAHLVIGDTKHGHFSEIFGWVKSRTRTMVCSTTHAFLDAHFKGDPASRHYLERELRLVAFDHGSWAL